MSEFVIDPEKLKRARGLMSQADAAKKLGISYQLLYAYESGRATPPLKKLLIICQTYGIKVEQLLPDQKILAAS